MATCRYVDISIPEAQIFADLTGIEADLTDIQLVCNRIIKDEVAVVDVESLNIAALIKYARCFSTGSRANLSIEDLADLTNEQKLLHNELIAIRSKHIAHSVNAFEYNSVVVHLNPEERGKKLLGITGQHQRVSSIGKADLFKLIELADIAKCHVAELKKAEEEKIRVVLEKLPIDKFYSKEASPLRSTKDTNPKKKRKDF